MFIPQVLEAEDHTGREDENEEVEIHEERRPSGGLMLADRGNNWDVPKEMQPIQHMLVTKHPGSTYFLA